MAGGSTAWWTTTSQPYVAGRAGPRLEVTLAGLVLSTSDLCSGITCFLMFRGHLWGAIPGGWRPLGQLVRPGDPGSREVTSVILGGQCVLEVPGVTQSPTRMPGDSRTSSAGHGRYLAAPILWRHS